MVCYRNLEVRGRHMIDTIIFDDDNYTSVAEWCNANNAHIEEIDADSEGKRRFKVVSNPAPTAEEIAERELAEATSVEARLSAMEDALAELLGGVE